MQPTHTPVWAAKIGSERTQFDISFNRIGGSSPTSLTITGSRPVPEVLQVSNPVVTVVQTDILHESRPETVLYPVVLQESKPVSVVLQAFDLQLSKPVTVL